MYNSCENSYSGHEYMKENNSEERKQEKLRQKKAIKRAKRLAKLKQPSKRKLLVLDLNGILVDFVENPITGANRFTTIANKAVFKRPYCEEFLQFCFEHFDVGVWSSSERCNVVKAVDDIFGESKLQLQFIWNQLHCTSTGYNTLEYPKKLLVLKELTKIWRKQVKGMPWVKGKYDVSNTLLIDCTPYKAICNPPNTSIFPAPYSYLENNDDDLGPGGKIRVYLESLISCDNVQRHVEGHPFNDQEIKESHRYWPFYKEIIEYMPLKKGIITEGVDWENEDAETREKHELKKKRKQEKRNEKQSI